MTVTKVALCKPPILNTQNWDIFELLVTQRLAERDQLYLFAVTLLEDSYTRIVQSEISQTEVDKDGHDRVGLREVYGANYEIDPGSGNHIVNAFEEIIGQAGKSFIEDFTQHIIESDPIMGSIQIAMWPQVLTLLTCHAIDRDVQSVATIALDRIKLSKSNGKTTIDLTDSSSHFATTRRTHNLVGTR